MGLLSNYRSFTLYDFSNVVKLKIYVFNATTHTLKDVLPAQINPDQINFDVHQKGIAQAASIIDQIFQGKTKDSYDNNITVTFRFNIADEYDARTARGKIPLSIDIDKITIIGALRTYSSNKYISIIKWASLEEVVRIKNVECTYTLYSPYGEPLAADVTVTFSVADDYQFGTSFLKASVRTKSLIDRGLVATSLATNYASSEFIPSIVSNARKQESQYEE